MSLQAVRQKQPLDACYEGTFKAQLTLWEPAREDQEKLEKENRKIEVKILCNRITGVTSHLLSHALLVQNKSWIPPTYGEGILGCTDHWKLLRAHLPECLTPGISGCAFITHHLNLKSDSWNFILMEVSLLSPPTPGPAISCFHEHYVPALFPTSEHLSGNLAICFPLLLESSKPHVLLWTPENILLLMNIS